MSKADPIAQKDRECNEASEPEDHGQAFHAQNHGCLVVFALGEAHGHDDQVGEGDQGEDCAEEQEADLRGRACVPVAAPPVGDCMPWLASCCNKTRRGGRLTIARQAEDEYCEKRLDRTQDEGEAALFIESHVDVVSSWRDLVCMKSGSGGTS